MTTKVEKSITVDVPVSTAYNQWTQFEEFPEFMGGVQQVEQLDDLRLHWVAEIAGVRREWYADILEQRPDEKVAWAATEGATNAGAVYFTPAGAAQTNVRLELEYEPEGAVEKIGDAANIIDRQAEADLEKFKTYIESRVVETGGWRGDVEGGPVGTPGVESTTSQGDSGKAGMSGKAKAAGVAAAAAGVAAAAAAKKSGSNQEPSTTETTEAPPVAEVDVVETTYVEDDGVGGMAAPPAAAGDELLSEDQIGGTQPGVGDENDPNTRRP